MAVINDRTPNLSLALPNEDNTLKDDVARLRSALTDIDTILPTKADLVAGKVQASQLPSYVDDVIEVANFAALPGSGETGKIYVLITPNVVSGVSYSQYRWSGSTYIAIVASPGSTDAVAEGGTNLYFTNARAKAAVGAVFEDVIYTPTSNGQTVLPVSGGYTVGKLDVFEGGVLLFDGGDDYTATDGTSVTLTSGTNTSVKFRFRKWNY